MNDDDTAATAKEAAAFLRQGASMSRVPWAEYTGKISKEETFFRCPHTQPDAEPPEPVNGQQLALIS